jgi:hypothetical protein
MSPHDQIALLCISLGGAFFCSWNAYWGIRDGRTWYWPVREMDRRTDPWNYRLAMCLWAFFACLFTVGFALLLYRYAKGN